MSTYQGFYTRGDHYIADDFVLFAIPVGWRINRIADGATIRISDECGTELMNHNINAGLRLYNGAETLEFLDHVDRLCATYF